MRGEVQGNDIRNPHRIQRCSLQSPSKHTHRRKERLTVKSEREPTTPVQQLPAEAYLSSSTSVKQPRKVTAGPSTGGRVTLTSPGDGVGQITQSGASGTGGRSLKT